VSVQQNPYEYWSDERSESDYRSRETQASSLTRQMLRQPEYLRSRNRVNPGPLRNSRAQAADSSIQTPHETRNEDIWGWQRWTEKDYYLVESEVSNNLLEETDSGTGSGGEIIYPDYTSGVVSPTVIPTSRSGVFEYTQSEASDTWLITHNLGFYPSVELFNSLRGEVEGNVTHVSRNAVSVTFNMPISGYARLN